jgi:glycosyltransferase involved in cell wall biosynthesis
MRFGIRDSGFEDPGFGDQGLGIKDSVLSIIVPAHNEEVLLGATLDALAVAVRESGTAAEIVVVDDASTDRTAAIARDHGARVIGVNVRQIAAARNAGARAADGELLLFVDADTIVPPHMVRAAVETMRGGAVGGGACAVFEPGAPRWAHRAIAVAALILRTAGWAPGCFIFARRDAFGRAGGFDERYFASEEIHLSRALKRVGRFVMLPDNVLTSARKAEHYSMWHSLWLMVRMAWPGSLRTREGLDFWYTRRNKT